MLLLAASLFFTTPAPLDMPRAEAYLVTASDGSRRLEDRYDVFDMWMCRAVDGRWMDDDFRVFVLATLDALPPAIGAAQAETRATYEAQRVAPDRKNEEHLATMVDMLSPVEPAKEFARPRQKPRGCRDVRYWQGTNTTAVVCTWLPEKSDVWRMATWELAESDDFDAMLEAFEREFIEKRAWETPGGIEPAKNPADGAKSRRRRRGEALSERELLRRDLRHSVAAYPSWRMTDAEEFSIIDCLPARGFAEALTNDLPVMRAKYAAAVPSPVDVTNTLSVARIYSSRDDYLEAAGDDMQWSAAYWNPQRRELVAYLPEQGEAELLKTIRHEAFHQYLSYACSMISASPWFNEGYAQYFEDTEDAGWKVPVTAEDLNRFEDAIPSLMFMDYQRFYDGSDAERRMKYRLAWSLAFFLEKGAPKVRFRPFESFKRDYIEALLKTRDMRKATETAFRSMDRLKNFVSEWKKFWLRQGL